MHVHCMLIVTLACFCEVALLRGRQSCSAKRHCGLYCSVASLTYCLLNRNHKLHVLLCSTAISMARLISLLSVDRMQGEYDTRVRIYSQADKRELGCLQIRFDLKKKRPRRHTAASSGERLSPVAERR
jgi:hypothetical protein